MTLKAPKIATTSQDHDGSLLTVSNGLTSSAPPTASASKTYHSALSEKLANFGEDLKNEDLKDIQELGQGNGGSVKKVEHTPTGTIMAKKVCVFPSSPRTLPFYPRLTQTPHLYLGSQPIYETRYPCHYLVFRIQIARARTETQIVLIDAKPSVRKQILRELQIMHDCNSPYIISFYGAFISDPNICICMEFMDKGSLDGIYKQIGPIDIDVVAKVALAVLEGLTYLYDVHRIIHRGEFSSAVVCSPFSPPLSRGNFCWNNLPMYLLPFLTVRWLCNL